MNQRRSIDGNAIEIVKLARQLLDSDGAKWAARLAWLAVQFDEHVKYVEPFVKLCQDERFVNYVGLFPSPEANEWDADAKTLKQIPDNLK